MLPIISGSHCSFLELIYRLVEWVEEIGEVEGKRREEKRTQNGKENEQAEATLLFLISPSFLMSHREKRAKDGRVTH